MIEKDGFYTMKGYQSNASGPLTASMEDYLEMICRMAGTSGMVRISGLAQKLHVKSSSASKMTAALKELGYVDFEKYGYIRPTPKGHKLGTYLLYRHEVLHTFLCLLNDSQNELEQVEKIEHFLSPKTITNLDALSRKLSGPEPEDDPY